MTNPYNKHDLTIDVLHTKKKLFSGFFAKILDKSVDQYSNLKTER